jgi:cyanophycinase-like exopeptidase
VSGRIIIMGSGELAPGLVATHRGGIEAADAERVTVLDTPYGFQENADELTERITTFFETSLVRPTEVATLRRREPTPGETARAIAAVRSAGYVFAGPGSPTYALDIWEGAGMADALAAVLATGGTVCFASAAALSLGSRTIPVYEVYKVGEEPAWRDGLDVLGRVGLPVPVVPHWDNAEGGTHDTSRCYIGRTRFEVLMAELATGALGVDEHTAAVLDLDAGELTAAGRGSVTLWTHDEEVTIPAGGSVALDDVRESLLGAQPPARIPTSPPRAPGVDEAIAARDAEALLGAVLALEEPVALRDALVRLVDVAAEGLVDPEDRIGGFVDLVLTARSRARETGAYDLADDLRDGLVDLGVEVSDLPGGTRWSLRSDG